jgi:hypothetical protein
MNINTQPNSESILPRLPRGRRPKQYPAELLSLIRDRHAGGWSIGQNAFAAGLPKSTLYKLVRSTPKLAPWVPDPNWVEDAE